MMANYLQEWIDDACQRNRERTYSELSLMAESYQATIEKHLSNLSSPEVIDDLSAPLGLLHRLELVQKELVKRPEWQSNPVDYFDRSNLMKENKIYSPIINRL